MNEFTGSDDSPQHGGDTTINSMVQQEERELASRLRASIDRIGKYSYRLDDMAAGFAAGRGVSPLEARRKIENLFENTYSCSLKKYMEQRFKDRSQGPGR